MASRPVFPKYAPDVCRLSTSGAGKTGRDERGERIRKISSQGKFSGSAKATFRASHTPLRESSTLIVFSAILTSKKKERFLM